MLITQWDTFSSPLFWTAMPAFFSCRSKTPQYQECWWRYSSYTCEYLPNQFSICSNTLLCNRQWTPFGHFWRISLHFHSCLFICLNSQSRLFQFLFSNFLLFLRTGGFDPQYLLLLTEQRLAWSLTAKICYTG